MKPLLQLAIALIFINYCNGYIFLCELDDDCGGGGKCDRVRKICECIAPNDYNLAGTKCLPLSRGISEDCEEHMQCSILTGNYACIHNKCSCAGDWMYFKGKCIQRRLNGERCTVNDDCFDGYSGKSRQCSNGICACKDGYYPRGNYDCRLIGSDASNTCILDLDCRTVVNTTCVNNKCVEKTRFEDYFVEDIEVVHDVEEEEEEEEEEEIEISTLSNFSNGFNNNVPCDDDNAHYTTFFDGCLCNEGFTFDSTTSKCKKELGSVCSAGSECINNKPCKDGICTCSIDIQNFSDDNRDCVKGKMLKCTADLACKFLGNNYACAPDPDDPNFNKCQCKPGYKLSELYICEKSAEPCGSNTDCTPNSKCINGECVCDENFVGKADGQCHPLLGSKCTATHNCTQLVEKSECLNNICTCSIGYIEHIDQNGNQKCLKLKRINEECFEDKQCSGQTFNSHCLDKESCVCKDEFVNIEDSSCLQLAKRIGDFCSHGKVCESLDGDVLCTKGKCQCADGSKVTKNKKGCEKNSTIKLNAPSSIFYTILSLIIYEIVSVS